MARRTSTITVGTTSETVASMGLMFIQELMEDAFLPDTPAQIKRDWYTLAAWLGQSGDRLTPEQEDKFAKAWTGYFALGSAPSFRLQPTFLEYARELPDKPKTTPPLEIIRVFERMLASDEEIHAKHMHDFAKGREVMNRLEKSFAKSKTSLLPAGWSIRKIAFWTIAWALTVFGYAWLSDPFDVGGWDEIGDAEVTRLIAVSLVPSFAGASVALYNKWVR